MLASHLRSRIYLFFNVTQVFRVREFSSDSVTTVNPGALQERSLDLVGSLVLDGDGNFLMDAFREASADLEDVV